MLPVLLGVLFFFQFHGLNAMNDRETNLVSAREEVREAFFHSISSYMKYGFPHDEVMPLSCAPRMYNNRSRGQLDDMLGGFMLTLIDSLDTFIVMREFDAFNEASHLVRDVSFSKDVNVSVFEVSIRVVGGLLSAHQFSIELHKNNTRYDPYDNKLLHMAEEVAQLLLPAFDTPSGIPIHRVNLLYGKIPGEPRTTCPAAGGSFLMEFSLLSQLTGNSTYEEVAYKALAAIWNARSKIKLIGSIIDVDTSQWREHQSSIGAGSDSFYETMYKGAILMNNMTLLNAYEESQTAVYQHLKYREPRQPKDPRTTRGSLWFLDKNMHKGKKMNHGSPNFSALQAFYPALLVLHGKVDRAVETFNSYLKIWHRFHGALPDIFNLQTNSTALPYGRDYPLRPEMIEAAYFLYMATRDVMYLQFGLDALQSIQQNCRVACGYAAIKNVNKNKPVRSKVGSSIRSDRIDTQAKRTPCNHLGVCDGVALEPSSDGVIVEPSPLLTWRTVNVGIKTHTPAPISARKAIRILDDRMDSYFLAETLKYLYLLFDEGISDHEQRLSIFCDASTESDVCVQKSHVLFTTEGHIFMLPSPAPTAKEKANVSLSEGAEVVGHPPSAKVTWNRQVCLPFSS